ncbi:hypothetical protein [Cohnella sp. GbtcB17]|uniref:hypothetical protein n=1 Tax=Cohnella sp. GbtcB17 TaxID=2824762 RepID=UPI001C2F3CCC|nr:hypothetical protein [Cohnella sp. GbtcB17]
MLLSLLLAACQSGATGGERPAAQSYAPVPSVSVGPSAEPKPQLASRSLNERAEASDVKWVYMTWPLRSDLAATLYPDRDEERISQLIGWIEAARPIEGAGLASPIKDHSMAVNVELQDGRLIVVRPAWRCTTTKFEMGNVNLRCEDAFDRVVIEDHASESSRVETVFAESSQLYRFIDEDYKVWMPPVQKYEYPEKLKPGTAFAVSGHGSRSQSATVTLSKGDAVLWTGKSDVRDGEWKVEGKLPDALASGKDYSLKIQTDEGGTTVYPDVE